MYNDGSVLMHSLNHPACEGMILDLYEEGLDAAIRRGRLDGPFVSFMHGVAREALNSQNLPERRTPQRSPDRVTRGESQHRCLVLHCGASLFDPLLHPDLLPCGTEAGHYPPTGCTQRQLQTATVPWAWMTDSFPASPPGSDLPAQAS